MAQSPNWKADPLIWGSDGPLFEVFLEPTCPFSAIAFSKLEALREKLGEESVRVQI